MSLNLSLTFIGHQNLVPPYVATAICSRYLSSPVIVFKRLYALLLATFTYPGSSLFTCSNEAIFKKSKSASNSVISNSCLQSIIKFYISKTLSCFSQSCQNEFEKLRQVSKYINGLSKEQPVNFIQCLLASSSLNSKRQYCPLLNSGVALQRVDCLQLVRLSIGAH